MNNEMNFEQARQNMIEQQIRTWEVLDHRILDLLEQVHREDFVPPAYRNLALADVRIPIGHDEVTMTPKVEARILQSVAIQPHEQVLEIGTGCAYFTALLASSGQHVTSVDIYKSFTQEAFAKLQSHSLTNITLETGDASRGWGKDIPYDAIILTGSLPVMNPVFQQQLKPGGRLFVITGTDPVMEAHLITRVGDQEWRDESLFETNIPPLINAVRPEPFKL